MEFQIDSNCKVLSKFSCSCVIILHTLLSHTKVRTLSENNDLIQYDKTCG